MFKYVSWDGLSVYNFIKTKESLKKPSSVFYTKLPLYYQSWHLEIFSGVTSSHCDNA